MYDLIIIGAGPAGITAAVYAIRKQMKVLVLSEDIGGQTAWSGDIENYLGYQFITGADLTMKFQEHMKRYGIEVKEGESVKSFTVENNTAKITTQHAEYLARTAIIASGKRPRELNVPGEREYRGKGVAYCATCDGPLFAKKDVAIIGGGNSGLEAALQIMRIAHHVYLITNGHSLTGDGIMQKKLKSAENVSIFLSSDVVAIEGKRFVERIIVKTNDQTKTIPLSGVFVEIGLSPNTEFVHNIDKNQWNEIIVNNRNETNVPYVFAAGDVTDVPEKQIIIAAGEGAKAALSAFRYLSLQNN